MLATNSTSAGVYTQINDRSQRITAEATSIGAMVGASKKGPIGVPTLSTDNEDFRNVFGKKDPRFGVAHYCAEGFLSEANRLYFLRVARNAKYGGVVVFTDNNYSATRHPSAGFTKPTDVTLTAQDIMLVYGRDEGEWNNDLWIEFFPNTADSSGDSFFLRVYEGTNTVASEEYLGTCFRKTDAGGKQMFIEDIVNAGSSRIRIRFNKQHAEFANTNKPQLINAIGGGIRDDVNNELNGQLVGGTNGDAITTGDIIQAWDKFIDPEEIDVNILINAGYSDPAIQIKMNTIAGVRQDCIAVLDLPSNVQETQAAIDYRRNILNINDYTSALYGPDLIVRDTENGVDVQIPPSGHVAAVYARTDENEAPWFAPAGIQNGYLNGILGLAQDYKQGHRNALVENQINIIRSISGQGTLVWGADTLYTVKSALQDVGIVRMLAMLQAAVKINNNYAVFQPIDELLFDKQRGTLEALLEPVRRGRGVYWYEVICDRRNNTNDTIANGDVIIDVYLDPTRYTKRIHLNAVVPKTGQLQAAVEFISNT